MDSPTIQLGKTILKVDDILRPQPSKLQKGDIVINLQGKKGKVDLAHPTLCEGEEQKLWVIYEDGTKEVFEPRKNLICLGRTKHPEPDLLSIFNQPPSHYGYSNGPCPLY